MVWVVGQVGMVLLHEPDEKVAGNALAGVVAHLELPRASWVLWMVHTAWEGRALNRWQGFNK